MKTNARIRSLLLLTALVVGGVSQAQAGCLGGALAGGIAGHYMGRHTLLGAAAGCAIGHHLAKEKQEQEAQNRYNSGYSNTARNYNTGTTPAGYTGATTTATTQAPQGQVQANPFN